jgi:flavorubredoxin
MINTSISESVRYIGVEDRDIDLFESLYPVPEGVTYNSYVILDEKIAVMDTVDGAFTFQWLQNLEKALNGRTPDYLVISHMEPDHSGSIGALAEKYPNMQLIGNQKTFVLLKQLVGDYEGRTISVKEGDTLSLGGHTLKFFMAPMIHWPEVMVSFEESEKILFSADAFGTFGTEDAQDWSCEARRYYFNIVGKYGPSVQALLKKLSGTEISRICPLHGSILSGDLSLYLEKYSTWSSYAPESDGVAIVYGSIHGNTGAAAKKLYEALKSRGETAEIFDLARCDMSEAVEAAFRYDRLVIASVTKDTELFPAVQTFMGLIKNRNYQSRTVGIIENGSWAPTAAKLITDEFAKSKNLTLLPQVVTLRSALSLESEAQLAELAEALKK